MEGGKIQFTINNDKYSFEIKIDDFRKKYSNKDCDVTIIEIKENDNLDMNSFLEIDDQIFKDSPDDIYRKKSIYLLGHQKGGMPTYAMGIIKDIDEEDYEIRHLCKTNPGSSGCPIINLNNNRVIGIHKGAAKNGQNWNIGILLKEPLKHFKEENLNNIIIKYNIKENHNEEDKNDFDEITIIYEVKKENKTIGITNEYIEKIKNELGEAISENKIFGENFVKNNKNKCKMIINGKEIEISSYLDNETINLFKDKIEIKLKGINKIIDSSFMFCGCISLKSLLDISNWNVKNVNKMKCMFFLCQKLENISDISNWDINNVTDMSGIFQLCSSLKSLPDISKWNTNKVVDMECMFSKCSSLKTLPDISKWNTNNVTNMYGMFLNCSSLKTLPDISKWNTNKVVDMERMFYECSLLKSIPDISKWNTNNVINMKYMFSKCSLLKSLPDISKWNTNNVTNMSAMFSICSLLKSLPDISKWNTNKVVDMEYIFSKCSLLKSIPDISKWNTNNVTNMKYMFYECSLLKSLPDISKWNTNKVVDMECMFSKCSFLKSLPDISKWNINNANNMNDIFYECSSLKSLYIVYEDKIEEKRQIIKIIKEGFIREKISLFRYEKRFIILDSLPRIILESTNYYRKIPLNKKYKISLVGNNSFDLIAPDKTFRFKGIENNGNEWARLIADTINEFAKY